MKRVARFLTVTAAGVCLFCLNVFAQPLLEKTFVYTGARWASPNTNVSTFWEAPALTAGETRSGGTLVLENTSAKEVTLTLSEMDFPEDNADAMIYLDALRLQIRDGDTVLFDDSYSRIASNDALALQIKLAAGEKKVLSVSLSCAFRYAGQLEEPPVLTWTFDSEAADSAAAPAVLSLQPIALIASITGAVVFGGLFFVLLITYIRRRRANR